MKYLIALLIVTLPHLSQAAAYIKFDGVDGESKASQAAASGLPTGKRQHKPVAITRPLDQTSPQRMPATDCANDPATPARNQNKACEHRGHVTVLK